MTTGEMIAGRLRSSGRPRSAQEPFSEADLKKIVRETVNETLMALGIEHADPREMQADFIYLRSWRMTMEQSRLKVFLVTITIVVTGTAAAIWAGLASQFR